MEWDPNQYLHFADERLRPFAELVARVGADEPRRVVDLGCGPGNATVLLRRRWPTSDVLGVDSSAEMIDTALAGVAGAGLSFALADAREFVPEAGTEVLISNATLQWVPDHRERFPIWTAALAPAGWFAFQVPAMQQQPSHALMHALARRPRYGGRLEPLVRENWIESPETYLETLVDLGCTVDMWETTYHHVLHGEDAVFEWTSGTSLRPFLAALEDDEREEFVATYKAALAPIYPRRAFGTPYAFRRLFVVAQRG